MERVRQLRDAIKNRYSKPCCIKVGVGVGVGVLLLIVVVVAATVAGGGGSDGGGDSEEGGVTNAASVVQDNGGGSTRPPVEQLRWQTEDVDPTNKKVPQPLNWQHQFIVQLESQGFSQILAIDDVSQRYVIEINSNTYFNLYIIVDFPKKQHLYVIIEKGENDAFTNVVEKKVLYCESSPFATDFNGRFTSSSTLREGGSTYREQVSGRTATLDTSYVNAPYTVSPTLVTILNGACQSLTPSQRFQWDSKLSQCGDNTTAPVDSLSCSNDPCPNFPTNALSTRQACTNFRKCNYVMSKCDSSWTKPYDRRPYCWCRSRILADIDNINCPAVGDDGGECAMPKRDIQAFETHAACYCRYRISRIYPKILPSSVQTISWEIKASIITAPANKYTQCPC